MQKQVSYQTTNTYDTLYQLTAKTKNVWLVLHGIGYLSRYFIRLFQPLDPEENYIIAPQAPSKYYKDSEYKKVGSSWLTKENTKIDTANILRYLDSVITAESIPDDVSFIILGYSQGVSIAARFIASRKTHLDHLILISGAFPKELRKEDFDFLTMNTKITHIVGENDPYFEKKNVELEQIRVKEILPTASIKTHPGGHELDLASFKNLF